MPFRQLTLTNFQKHKALTIEFDPKVTTLVGSTDAGKSTVIRALALVCLSVWEKCFVRHGKKSLQVKLDCGGRMIIRAKGERLNVFSIDGKEFTAFAHSVPPEIAEALNVTEDNFQFQLDTHFWFGDTSGQVSKKLNQIVNLDVIDRTLDKVASKVREGKAALAVCVERKKKAKKEVESLEWVKEVAADYAAIEAIETRSRELRDKCVLIASDVKRARTHARRYGASKTAYRDARNVLRSARECRAGAQQIRDLKNLITEFRKIENDLNLPELDLTELVKIRKEGDRLAEDHRELEYLVSQLADSEERLCQLDEKIAQAEARLAKVKICPTCRRPLASATSSPTCTYPTKHLSPGPKKKTGKTSSSAASLTSGDCATTTNVPW